MAVPSYSPTALSHLGGNQIPLYLTDSDAGSIRRKAGGHIERLPFPNTKHAVLGQESADTTKCIAGVRELIGRYLAKA